MRNNYAIYLGLGILLVLGAISLSRNSQRPTPPTPNPLVSELECLPLDELAKRAGVNPIMVWEGDRQDLIMQILNPLPGRTKEELAQVKVIQDNIQNQNEARVKAVQGYMAEDQRHNRSRVVGLKIGESFDVGSNDTHFTISAEKPFSEVRFWLCQAPDVKFSVNGRGFWPKNDTPAILTLRGETQSLTIVAKRLDPALPGTIELSGITVR